MAKPELYRSTCLKYMNSLSGFQRLFAELLLNGASNYPTIYLLNRTTLHCRVNLVPVIFSYPKKQFISS